MKIKEILQKQGKIYSNLPSNEIIEECNEKIPLKEAWEFLENVSKRYDIDIIRINGLAYAKPKILDSPLSDGEITQIYLKRGFKDVLIADAFNKKGNPVPSMRAVYVKR